VRVRRLGGDRAGEIRLTRLLRNDAVTVDEMMREAAARTAQRCDGVGHVLAIHDTTSIQSTGGGGLYLHAMIAVDAEDGAVLGLVHGQFLERESGRRGKHHELPIEAKESRRWLEGAEQGAQVCASAGQVTVVADREGDIYEAFARRPSGVELLVRASHDRSLDGKNAGRLFAKADALPAIGEAIIDLPAKPGRRVRQALLAARVMQAELKRPLSASRDAPASIALTLIDIREIDPPTGEAPIHWRLLTTHRAANAAEAFAVADLYRRRWAIEQLFRTLKTQGFDIEGLRIAEPQPRFKLVTAALIAAVVVQQMVHARDGASDPARLRPVTDAFDPADVALLEAFCLKLQGKTERQKNPHPPGTLAYAAWVCARLGGWTGYYGKPGPVVMLQGWQRFQDARAGVHALIGQLDV
jgi:hypothetical protein